ncbi:MAG: serine hydrolase, partial [Thermodesulfobacteriota bacterium]
MKLFTRKRVFLGVLMVLAILAGLIYQKREYLQQLPIGCAFKAKALCAAVFVSGRDPAIVEREDIGFNALFKLFPARIDRTEKSVSCSFLGTGLWKKKAVYVHQIGSVLLSGLPQETVLSWKPAIPKPEPEQPESVPWPTGDRLPETPLPATVNPEKIKALVDRLFVETDPAKKLYTRAVVVVHDGRLVQEKYGPGITKDTPLLSWSMAKSVTNALIGILVKNGKINIKDPAPVPEWQKSDDPRQRITLDQLLRMGSGLEWVEAYAERPVSDVNIMLLLKPDMGAFAASKPLKAEPDTLWHYSSGTTNIIQRIIRENLGSREAYWGFPRQELFNKIGMRSAVWETDASGTFIGSSYLLATARDYARFGLLFLNDGVWQGERILPEGWVSYCTTPTPAAPKGQYGAHFWLNGGKESIPESRPFPLLPGDAFFARGYQGQIIVIIPSRKLVIVRLGMTYDEKW